MSLFLFLFFSLPLHHVSPVLQSFFSLAAFSFMREIILRHWECQKTDISHISLPILFRRLHHDGLFNFTITVHEIYVEGEEGNGVYLPGWQMWHGHRNGTLAGIWSGTQIKETPSPQNSPPRKIKLFFSSHTLETFVPSSYGSWLTKSRLMACVSGPVPLSKNDFVFFFFFSMKTNPFHCLSFCLPAC